MIRRAVLTGLIAGVAAPALGHTTYRQWVVYRKKHLLIGCHRQDPETYDIAKSIVADLDDALPAARARPARAPRPERLASLLGTEQLEVAVLAPEDAREMAVGHGRFEPYGVLPLRVLSARGDRLLIAHERLPARHGWLVSEALGLVNPADMAGLSWHPGAQAFRTGQALPD